MEIQRQFLDRVNASTYWEQTFITNTRQLLTIEEYNEMDNMLKAYLIRINKY